jgi:carbon starvation protein CstA
MCRSRGLADNALRKLIKGTFLATLLLAAQEGGKPFNEAAWIFVGAVLTTVVDAYATHMSGQHEDGVSAYFGSLYSGIVGDQPRIIGALPTVLLLVLVAIFHWNHDHRTQTAV